MNSDITKLQERALLQAKYFLKNQNLDNPNLTGKIWSLLNDENIQINIDQANLYNLELQRKNKINIINTPNKFPNKSEN